MNPTEAKTQSQVRQSRYCTAIVSELQTLGHATNTQLLAALQRSYPTLSATTVHRATARLAQRGDIATAPPDSSGAMRYDTHTTHTTISSALSVANCAISILSTTFGPS